MTATTTTTNAKTKARHAKDAALDQCKYFHGFLSRDDVDSLLPNKGDFLLRKSETTANLWNYVLSVRCHDDKKTIRHYVLHRENGVYAFRNNRPYKDATVMIDAHLNNHWPLDSLVPTAVLTKAVLKQDWELDHKDMQIGNMLGQGQFGDVFKGALNLRGKTVPVAIKTLKISTTDKAKIQLIMKEARLMRTLDHPNVLKLHGVACKREPVMIVMELVNGGSLDKYLRDKNPSMETKLQFAKGAAKGLEYLHSRGVIHRDIAARNCLYDANTSQVKIGDFGLSVHARQYVAVNEKLPIKWLAPEVLRTTTFTHKSDVYAFGVLLWEIFNNGRAPYAGWSTTDVQRHVINGGKLTYWPEGTPDFIKKIADYCWVRNPDNRWNMKQVVEKMDLYIHPPKPTTSTITSRTSNTTTARQRLSPSH